jgi:hypothetical protein
MGQDIVHSMKCQSQVRKYGNSAVHKRRKASLDVRFLLPRPEAVFLVNGVVDRRCNPALVLCGRQHGHGAGAVARAG